MARITVEDCLDDVENRFELVALASRRAHDLSQGAEPLVSLRNDKPTVLALREIAEGLIDSGYQGQEVEQQAVPFSLYSTMGSRRNNPSGDALEQGSHSLENLATGLDSRRRGPKPIF